MATRDLRDVRVAGCARPTFGAETHRFGWAVQGGVSWKPFVGKIYLLDNVNVYKNMHAHMRPQQNRNFHPRVSISEIQSALTLNECESFSLSASHPKKVLWPSSYSHATKCSYSRRFGNVAWGFCGQTHLTNNIFFVALDLLPTTCLQLQVVVFEFPRFQLCRIFSLMYWLKVGVRIQCLWLSTCLYFEYIVFHSIVFHPPLPCGSVFFVANL